MSKWWWPFKRNEEKEAESEFESQLKEALLRKDDLRAAAAAMKKERVQRLERSQSSLAPRPKLDSQPTTG